MTTSTRPSQQERTSEEERRPEALRPLDWTRWEWWARVLAVLAAVVAIIELRDANHLRDEQNRLQRASLDSHLGEVMMDLDRHFVTYPHLRRYFYADKHGQRHAPTSGRVGAQALSTAELVIDFADDVAAYVRERKMPTEGTSHWAGIVREYFEQSPVTRRAWNKYHDSYGVDTACVLGGPPRGRTRGWDWKTNAPRYPWGDTCG